MIYMGINGAIGTTFWPTDGNDRGSYVYFAFCLGRGWLNSVKGMFVLSLLLKLTRDKDYLLVLHTIKKSFLKCSFF